MNIKIPPGIHEITVDRYYYRDQPLKISKMNTIETGKTGVKILKRGENHSALIGQEGIIVKILPTGYNVWLSYFNMPNYTDMIYFYRKSEVQIIKK